MFGKFEKFRKLKTFSNLESLKNLENLKNFRKFEKFEKLNKFGKFEKFDKRKIQQMAENKLYSKHFGVKSWICLIIGISIVYVKIKPYTKFDAKILIRSKVMID